MSTDDIEMTGKDKAEKLTSAAIARRHALLQGLGRGSVILAAATPIQTLASQTLLTPDRNHVCSISGMQSTMHSPAPNCQVCGGYSPGWWGQSQRGSFAPYRAWPILPNGWTCDTPCHTVFVFSHLYDTDGTRPSLFQVMEPKEPISKFANTDEFHWICAWLNALSHSFNFPYTGAQVLGFYNAGSASNTYKDALLFFKTYMETHTF